MIKIFLAGSFTTQVAQKIEEVARKCGLTHSVTSQEGVSMAHPGPARRASPCIARLVLALLPTGMLVSISTDDDEL